MEKPTVLECPFCESKKVDVVDGSFLGVKSFQVYCRSCLAKGPNATTSEEAITKWDITSNTEWRYYI